jgi:phosphoserine phosphatase RsbU/P
MSKLKLTLFQEILISVICIFILIGVCKGGYSRYILRRELGTQYESKGIAIAKSIADASPEIISSRDISLLQSMIDQFKEIQGIAYICVRDNKGVFIAHTFVPGIPEFLKNMPVVNMLDPHGKSTTTRLSVPGFGDILDISNPILIGQLGIVHVGMDLSIISRLLRGTFTDMFLITLLTFLISMAFFYKIIRRISAPIEQLKRYTTQLAEADFVASKELQLLLQNITTNSKNEVHDLAVSFHHLNEALALYIQNLQITTAEKNKIESELSIAREIQLNMLPKLDSQHPSGSRIHAYMEPATAVGGDFYDVIEIGDYVILSVGDVSGHGVPAALTMAICISLIRTIATQTQDPSEILHRVNGELCRHNDSAMFITAFLGVLHQRSGAFNYCLAGHPAPYLISEGVLSMLALTHGIPLGIDVDFKFNSSRILLQPHDHLVGFSDGITEADNPQKELYGENRLETILTRHADLAPKELCDEIVKDVVAFANSAPQADDITLLHIQWQPPEIARPTIGTHLKVDFMNDISELEHLQKVVGLFCSTHQLSGTMTMNINLILEELLTNIIFYGYQDHAQHVIYITFEKGDSDITLTIEDDAMAFNPLEQEAIDIDTLLEDKPIGGLGIHFVKNLTQSITYERTDDGNILRMVMTLS